MGRASFRETLFGNDERAYPRRIWPERRVDFTNTKFMTTTDFRKAAFGGVPAFFNATLHEDTDFGGVDWKKAETKHTRVDYAIRAVGTIGTDNEQARKTARPASILPAQDAHSAKDGRVVLVDLKLALRGNCRLWLGSRARLRMVDWTLGHFKLRPFCKHQSHSGQYRMVGIASSCTLCRVRKRARLSISHRERGVS